MVTARPGAGGAVGTGPSPQSTVNGGVGVVVFFPWISGTASDGDDDGGGALLPRTPVWNSETVVWEARAAADQRVRVASGQGEAKDNNNDINNRASVMYKGGLNERQSEDDEARQRRQEETKKTQPKVASSFLHQVRLQRGPEIQSEAPLASRWGWAGRWCRKGGPGRAVFSRLRRAFGAGGSDLHNEAVPGSAS